MIRSTFGYMYKRMPYPSDIRRYDVKAQAYFVEQDQAALADPDFIDFLIEGYVQASDKNTQNNINAGEYLHRAQAATVAVLVLVGLTSMPATYRYYLSVPEPQHTLIVNNGADMSDDAKGGKTTETTSEGKPERPQIIDVRTGSKAPKGSSNSDSSGSD